MITEQFNAPLFRNEVAVVRLVVRTTLRDSALFSNFPRPSVLPLNSTDLEFGLMLS
jgi:hypothetical protein